jgi:hypothetical protein
MCTASRNTIVALLLRSTENVFTARYGLNLKLSIGVLKGVMLRKVPSYYYYYYYYYLLQLNFHSVAVVLTLVTNKNKYT